MRQWRHPTETAMPTLLQINSSLFSDHGQSSRLADRFVAEWQARHPDGKVVRRDFALSPVPHLSADGFQAFGLADGARNAEQQRAVAYSDALIAELAAADVVVIGLPMYNFGVPSMLKAYFDHLARAGVTFRYTERGPVGLIGDKPVYVFAARGGVYAGTAHDTQTGYVRDFLRLLGIESVEFVYAEGLAMGGERRDAALAHAAHEIERLLPAQRAAV
jgi:FMN-dependent NADH-azoreductase